MQYHSTRGQASQVDSAQAVLNGLAPDGGLYLPKELPSISWRDCVQAPMLSMAEMILSAFLPDIPDMETLVEKAYTGKFDTDELTPTVKVGGFHVLELFHGPTSAFKDVALSMLPQLMTAAKTAKGDKKDILILTATSGDTGKAALEGFRDVEGVRICVFYPHGGVSEVQHRQMASQEGGNVTVCGVNGNFDDAQTGVKEIFNACQGEELPFRLSSANSINIGRLVPQITYYFKAYQDLLNKGSIAMGDRVNFCVPTGNFGDILAGYLAKLLGLPVGKLICASNANNVLTDFLQTGRYDRRRPLHKTESPSMDILVSSNLERLLSLLCGDAATVSQLMKQLQEQGCYQISKALLEKLHEEFWAGWCDDEKGGETIAAVWEEHRYLCDTHTAVAWAVAQDYVNQTGDTRPMVVLSTASPYKFPAAVLGALAQTAQGDEFKQMEQLATYTQVPIPKNLANLWQKPVLHKQVIEKEEMPAFVLAL